MAVQQAIVLALEQALLFISGQALLLAVSLIVEQFFLLVIRFLMALQQAQLLIDRRASFISYCRISLITKYSEGIIIGRRISLIFSCKVY